jgi:hypothetical protein
LSEHKDVGRKEGCVVEKGDCFVKKCYSVVKTLKSANLLVKKKPIHVFHGRTCSCLAGQFHLATCIY